VIPACGCCSPQEMCLGILEDVLPKLRFRAGIQQPDSGALLPWRRPLITLAEVTMPRRKIEVRIPMSLVSFQSRVKMIDFHADLTARPFEVSSGIGTAPLKVSHQCFKGPLPVVASVELALGCRSAEDPRTSDGWSIFRRTRQGRRRFVQRESLRGLLQAMDDIEFVSSDPEADPVPATRLRRSLRLPP